MAGVALHRCLPFLAPLLSGKSCQCFLDERSHARLAFFPRQRCRFFGSCRWRSSLPLERHTKFRESGSRRCTALFRLPSMGHRRVVFCGRSVTLLWFLVTLPCWALY